MKTAPDNIECFEAVAAAILAHLHESFPRPLLLNCRDFEESLKESDVILAECVWEQNKGRPNESLTDSTLQWICEEGLARYKNGSTGRYSGLVLTARGFTAMNSPVTPSESRETAGHKLAYLAKKSATFGISEALATVIRHGISGQM